MIAKYNTKSFIFGIPGFVLQILGLFFRDPLMGPEGAIISLSGLGLLVVGLMFYAKAKGQHPAWGLLGLLSIIGLIILACLEDRGTSQDSETTNGVNS